jgi:hypothetical protein
LPAAGFRKRLHVAVQNVGRKRFAGVAGHVLVNPEQASAEAADVVGAIAVVPDGSNDLFDCPCGLIRRVLGERGRVFEVCQQTAVKGNVVGPFLLASASAVLVRPQPTPTPPGLEELKLERDFIDPLTTLPEVVVRDSCTPTNFDTNVQTNQLIVRPLIPRIPPRSFLPFDQLIRPTVALVTVPSSRGGSLFDEVVAVEVIGDGKGRKEPTHKPMGPNS